MKNDGTFDINVEDHLCSMLAECDQSWNRLQQALEDFMIEALIWQTETLVLGDGQCSEEREVAALRKRATFRIIDGGKK